MRTRLFMNYGVAVLSVAAALSLRVVWWPVLRADSPFLFFFSALTLAAWYGGLWPGILCTLLGAFSVAFLDLLPIMKSGAVYPSHLLQYAIFILTGILASILMEKLHVAIQRSLEAERQLEKRVQERTAELIDANRKLHHLSGELLSAQETERLRISKELHDELGQALTLIKLKVGLIGSHLTESLRPLKSYCEDASSHVDQAIENMRRLSRDLSPVTVETLGITIALRRLAEEFSSAGRVGVKAEIARIDDDLSVHSAILLYRIVQEGLNNIVKHSGASEATLVIRKHQDVIDFGLNDNGIGFDFRERGPAEKSGLSGLGLAIMAERVRTLGGTLVVESGKGAGTMIHFSLKGTAADAAGIKQTLVSGALS